MTKRIPLAGRTYAPIEMLINDRDPERRLCVHYSGGVVRDDGSTIGAERCKADIVYSEVGIDIGEMVQALPCTHEWPICPRREWGPRRRERQGGGDADGGDDEGAE